MNTAPLAVLVGDLLKEHHLTLSTAESCTGGLIGHLITNVSGSSSYFMGGAIVYAYEAKEAVLNVQHHTLITYGAVSEETAIEMAQGARKLFGTDLALSATGIAGPTGGMPQKPVGLVYIALAAPDKTICQKFIFDKDREGNKLASAQAALTLLVDYLHEVKAAPTP